MMTVCWLCYITKLLKMFLTHSVILCINSCSYVYAMSPYCIYACTLSLCLSYCLIWRINVFIIIIAVYYTNCKKNNYNENQQRGVTHVGQHWYNRTQSKCTTKHYNALSTGITQIAVARAVIELIFVWNGSTSLWLGLDFADVNSFITLLCTSCTMW